MELPCYSFVDRHICEANIQVISLEIHHFNPHYWTIFIGYQATHFTCKFYIQVTHVWLCIKTCINLSNTAGGMLNKYWLHIFGIFSQIDFVWIILSVKPNNIRLWLTQQLIWCIMPLIKNALQSCADRNVEITSYYHEVLILHQLAVILIYMAWKLNTHPILFLNVPNLG